MFQFSSVGFIALFAVALCWSLAVVLFRTSMPGGVARKLSLLLVIEGVTLVSTGYIDLFLTESMRAGSWYPDWVWFEMIVHTLGDCAMLVLYPPFLAAALQTKLTRPFERRSVQLGVTLIAAVLFIAVFVTPLWLGATLLYLLLSLLFGFALVASIHAWRIQAGAARARARSFAIAFGVRDICWGIVYGGAIVLIQMGQYEVVDSDASGPIYVVYALGTLLAVPLIAYGILRTQLFDIDLRIRWTIRQSTVAAAFVAVFYLVTEGADRVLSDELGNWVGLLASAMLVFFLAPLQNFAERVANLAMPNTRNTPEYAVFRKLQVYQAAVEDAAPGGIGQKERALLKHLRDSLGISVADAEALERDVMEAPEAAEIKA
jgi:hypothetical protein